MTDRPTGRRITQLRAVWRPVVEAGRCDCPRCGHPITAGQEWDLGHVTDLALGGDRWQLLPEHSTCNRSAGATLGNQRRRGITSPYCPACGARVHREHRCRASVYSGAER